jgi:hypothetical protein
MAERALPVTVVGSTPLAGTTRAREPERVWVDSFPTRDERLQEPALLEGRPSGYGIGEVNASHD